jgi:hypothetical protein
VKNPTIIRPTPKRIIPTPKALGPIKISVPRTIRVPKAPTNISELLIAKAKKKSEPKEIKILEGKELPRLKLPRKVTEHAAHDQILQTIYSDLRKIWLGGELLLPHLTLTPSLEKALAKTRDFWQLEQGLENITERLRAEQKGLKALQEKEGSGSSLRASRLLLVSNDGTPRFYRICEKLMKEHGDRVLFLGLDVTAERLATNIVRSEKAVKAILVSDKNSVSWVLSALAISATDAPALDASHDLNPTE